MPILPPDEYALSAILLAVRDVAGLRAALSLASDLGTQEAAFVRAATLVFERMGREPAAPQFPVYFGAGWVDLLNQSVHELHQVLRGIPARDTTH